MPIIAKSIEKVELKQLIKSNKTKFKGLTYLEVGLKPWCTAGEVFFPLQHLYWKTNNIVTENSFLRDLTPSK